MRITRENKAEQDKYRNHPQRTHFVEIDEIVKVNNDEVQIIEVFLPHSSVFCNLDDIIYTALTVDNKNKACRKVKFFHSKIEKRD